MLENRRAGDGNNGYRYISRDWSYDGDKLHFYKENQILSLCWFSADSRAFFFITINYTIRATKTGNLSRRR